MTACRVKWSEILDSEVVILCIRGVFDLLVCKVILGSFGALNCLKVACNLKTAVHRAKQSKIWDLRVPFKCIWVTSDL